MIYLLFAIWQGILLHGSAFSSLNLIHELLFGTQSSVSSGSYVFDVFTSVVSYIIDIFLLAPFYNAFAPILDVVGFFTPLRGVDVYVKAGSISIALISYPFMLIIKFFDRYD
jgi:hypothetical protein